MTVAVSTQSSDTARAAGLSVYIDSHAEQVIAAPHFTQGWESLVEMCPWATVFQTPQFVRTWFQCYTNAYQPLVIARLDFSGKLDGFVALAVERATRQLVFAGAQQAEYQGWLALPGDEQTFVSDALLRLQRLGFPSLSFTSLPPGTPLQALERHFGHPALVHPVPNKLVMETGDGEHIRESLHRESNKGCEPLGKIEFAELKTLEELDQIYNDIIQFTDFRQGAANGSFVFRSDSLKREFFRQLMSRPGVLHAAVTRMGGQTVAAHIGFLSKGRLILGIFAYSPFFAEHCPGKLHLLQLALVLQKQGVTVLVLTRLEDSYKHLFASRYEAAYERTVHFEKRTRTRQLVLNKARFVAARTAGAVGLNRAKAASYSSAALKAASNPLRASRWMLRTLKHVAYSTTEVRFYRLHVSEIALNPDDPAIRRDCLQDVLCYEPPDQSQRIRQRFLQQALSRLEAGAHVYTIVEGEVLAHYGWLTVRPTRSFITEVQHPFEYPSNSALMWDFTTHPSYRRKGLYTRSLRRILGDALKIAGLEFVYIYVLADNWPSRHVIENVGFNYYSSIVRNMQAGRTKYEIILH